MPNDKKANKSDSFIQSECRKRAARDGARQTGRRKWRAHRGTQISLFAESVRSEAHLADGKTGADGTYSIAYARPSALNLLVRAYDATGKVVAQSATVFAAAGADGRSI